MSKFQIVKVSFSVFIAAFCFTAFAAHVENSRFGETSNSRFGEIEINHFCDGDFCARTMFALRILRAENTDYEGGE